MDGLRNQVAGRKTLAILVDMIRVFSAPIHNQMLTSFLAFISDSYSIQLLYLIFILQYF